MIRVKYPHISFLRNSFCALNRHNILIRINLQTEKKSFFHVRDDIALFVITQSLAITFYLKYQLAQHQHVSKSVRIDTAILAKA